MARARNIKPSFFKNEKLAECSMAARLLFAGLWTLADRRGILEYRPKRIKVEVFPYDDVDIEPLMEELEREGHAFIERYEAKGRHCVLITGFLEHNRPHKDEAANDLPAPTKEARKKPGDFSASPTAPRNPLFRHLR